MNSKTKIVVLHMKEIIYTAIFAFLGILFIVLLIFMFKPNAKSESVDSKAVYNPGVYTSSILLNNTELDIEVSVDQSNITSIRFSNLDETVTAMFPLIQPTIEDLADQIYETQSLDSIVLSEDTPYTSSIILNAIKQATEKAAVKKTAALYFLWIIPPRLNNVHLEE